MSIKLAAKDQGGKEGYAGGGARQCMHGYVCQMNLCALNFLRAYRSGYKFQLASEDSRIKDYDDIILKYEDEDGREIGLYFQSKHIQNCDDKAITTRLLLAGEAENKRKEERFMLSKYYESYLKNAIKSKQQYFIIYTNMGLDIEDLSKERINVVPQSPESTSHFFQIKSDRNTNCYKLSVDENHPLFEKFYTLSDAYKVAYELVKVIKCQEKLEMKNEVLKKYKDFLRSKVLFGSTYGELNRQFTDEFISCETKHDKFSTFKTFRNIFKKLYYEAIKPNYGFECEDDFQKDLRKKIIKVSQSFLLSEKERVMDNPDQSECIKSFFNEFILAVNQPNVEELEEIIKKEIEEIFSLKDTDLIVPVIKSKMLDWMKEKTGTWLARDDVESFILGIQQKLDTLMIRGISLDYQNELNKMNCIIRPHELEEDNTIQTIRDFLQGDCAIMLISSNHSLLSLLKVHQGIIWIRERNGFKCLEKDDDLLFLSFGYMVSSESVRNDLMNNNPFNLLVSHAQGTVLNDVSYHEYLKDFLNSIVFRKRKMILVFQEVVFDSIERIIGGFEERIFNIPKFIKDKSLSFLQLAEEAQNHLLQLEIVNFQGKYTNLLTFSPEIKKIMDAETLLCLLQKANIHVGQEIVLSDSYIPRQLSIDGLIDSEASNGNGVPTFISEDELLSNESRKVLIISGAPTAGKSCLALSLSNKLKMTYSSMWVLKIDLNDFAEICNKTALNTTLNEQYSYAEDCEKTIDFIIEKILGVPSDVKLTSRFEQELLKLGFSGEIKLALLIDGFSELSKDGSRFVLQLLLGMEKTKIEILLITTRPENKRHLECLQGKYFSLASLDGNDNLNMIRLNSAISLPRDQDDIYKSNVRRLGKFLTERVLKMDTEGFRRVLEKNGVDLRSDFQDKFESVIEKAIAKELCSATDGNYRSASSFKSIINGAAYILKKKLDINTRLD